MHFSIKGLLKALYVFATLFALAYVGLGDYIQNNLEEFFGFSNARFWTNIFQMEWPKFIKLAAVSIAVILAMNVPDAYLRRLRNPVLEWRLFSRSVNFIALDYPVLRLPFIALLYLSLPMLAFLEEFIFRDGLGKFPVTNWQDIMIMSAIFSIVHLISGYTLRECLCLNAGGIWFGYQYLTGGLMAATLAHFACNAIEFTYLLLKWGISRKNPFN